MLEMLKNYCLGERGERSYAYANTNSLVEKLE